jgi:surface polysaccharide O-acyltransferase-like enzyme
MAVYILHPLIVATLMRLSDLPREGTAMLAMVIGASLMASLLILRSPLRGWMA